MMHSGIERFPQEKTETKQNHNFWVGFFIRLFTDLVEESVKILTEHLPVKIKSLEESQNVECCTDFGLLAVLCSTPVFQPIHLILPDTSIC